MSFTYIDIVIAYDNQDMVIQIITWNSKDIFQFTKLSYLHKENNNCFNPPIFLFINIISTAKTSNMIVFLKVLNISNVQVNSLNKWNVHVIRTNFIEYLSPQIQHKRQKMNDLIWNLS